ncbi:NAD-dependent epimerase/dehydratase family protein [Devosia oryziradicis]|uniref:NAD-dependent epimerase/dehydratase family protein n=1 Tax=Devosia oryziradicis TaxID=2801335 RepID=A0ABX7BW95_9HYPH|nr:NAD-dependent epimerase/dehydratase family protein [Devosia oryziradicis]QQR34887.1 NAD-dependent epimerase/dehydratase family protein [Devosia oryziradicis]
MQTGLVLVTGANGFVGKWTVIELLRAGFDVRGTVRSEGRAEAVRSAVAGQLGDAALTRLSFVRLDLMQDRGWLEAMEGVTAVAHVAAQIVAEEPKDPQLVIGPAVEGTERVLRHAVAGGVRRVVMTSSIATVGYGLGHDRGKRIYTEDDFTDLDGMRFTWAYCVGKTLAEQAAWAYARSEGLELTTIHPGAILGPALDEDASISLGMVTGLLDGSTPAMPSNGFSVIDVRDVAALHVAALQQPTSIGHRYLATSDYVPFPQVARVLADAYPDRQITNKIVPDWIIKLLARFGGPTRQIINDIGNEKHFSREKGEALLGRPFISGRDAILASAESAIRLGLLKSKRA